MTTSALALVADDVGTVETELSRTDIDCIRRIGRAIAGDLIHKRPQWRRTTITMKVEKNLPPEPEFEPEIQFGELPSENAMVSSWPISFTVYIRSVRVADGHVIVFHK